MIRKFNYTNRVKLKTDSFEINLNQTTSGKFFDAQLLLKPYSFPEYAKIYVEAYYKTNYMRFNFGTISNFVQPSNTLLSDFTNTDLIYFRIKIVDDTGKNGKILALTSGIEPKGIEPGQKNRKPIIKVNYSMDLGQRLYHLELDEIEDLPILEINRKLDNASQLVKSDIFISTIYTSVVFEIANEIVNSDSIYDENEESWQGYWIKYFKQTLGIHTAHPIKTDENEQKKEWIEDILNSFCSKYKVRTKFASLNLL
jgi:hypothetical protein